MAKKLSQRKLDSMFKVYCERQSIEFISRKCRVSPVTVRKYRRLENWDERIVEVKSRAREKQNETLADLLANNLETVQFCKDKLIEKIEAGTVNLARQPIIDLDRLIRLELLLSGEVDSRREVVSDELRGLTTEQLFKLKKKLLKQKGAKDC